MTKSDQYDETRRAYLTLGDFITDNQKDDDVRETQSAREALQWIKTYIVGLELRAEQRQQSDIEAARRSLFSQP